MKARIWTDLNRPVPEFALAHLKDLGDVDTSSELGDLPAADIVIIGSHLKADGTFMDRAGTRLKAIARPGIGVDNIDIPAATERGILVVHTPDAPTESTAEHGAALLLGVAKRVVAADANLRKKHVSRTDLFGTETQGKTLGVVGFGRIGRRMAEICALGLKMNVVIYDPYLDRRALEQLSFEVETANSLETLLGRADFLTLHTPLTGETRHLIGERELRLMKKGAYLINVSRGPVVDEAALVRSLESGHLAGAALDVFDPEPPAPDHPLFGFNNVVVTPHVAAYTAEAERAMWEAVLKQVKQILRGERPIFLVNGKAWPGRAAQGCVKM